MSQRFLIKEIALQAGVATATVDRVLNERAHVREHTRQRVLDAVMELERQQYQLAARGRKLRLDVVVEAPRRFSEAVREALEAELPGLRPAVLRPRFLLRDTMPAEQIVEALHEIARRGSHGVLLKARELPPIEQAIVELQRREIPVVTLFTDLPGSPRIAYAGMDNRVAGTTAAYLLASWLGRRTGHVLTTMSDERFHGEEEREQSFRQALRLRRPDLRLLDASGGYGLDAPTEQRVRSAVAAGQKIVAVYSMGGGNAAILRALHDLGQQPAVFIGHDLDQENLALLREERLSAVLHHDLRQDMRAACQQIMCHHRLLARTAVTACSPIHVVTPVNIPPQIILHQRAADTESAR